MSDIVIGGWSDTWRTDLGYASVRSPDIRPPPQTISYTYRIFFVEEKRAVSQFSEVTFHWIHLNLRLLSCAWLLEYECLSENLPNALPANAFHVRFLFENWTEILGVWPVEQKRKMTSASSVNVTFTWSQILCLNSVEEQVTITSQRWGRRAPFEYLLESWRSSYQSRAIFKPLRPRVASESRSTMSRTLLSRCCWASSVFTCQGISSKATWKNMSWTRLRTWPQCTPFIRKSGQALRQSIFSQRCDLGRNLQLHAGDMERVRLRPLPPLWWPTRWGYTSTWKRSTGTGAKPRFSDEQIHMWACLSCCYWQSDMIPGAPTREAILWRINVAMRTVTEKMHQRLIWPRRRVQRKT